MLHKCPHYTLPIHPHLRPAISTAAAEVLISFFERDRSDLTVTSEVLPGVERSFTSFSSAKTGHVGVSSAPALVERSL